jgi:hypothetical protein
MLGVTVLLAGLAVGLGKVLAGDGKGSGDIQRAFGYMSAEDERSFYDFGLASQEANHHVVEMLADANRGRPRAAATSAAEAIRIIDRSLGYARAIENERLRSRLVGLAGARRDFAAAMERAARYGASNRGRLTRRADALVQRVEQAATGVARAQRDLLAQIRPYMTPEQRRQLREQTLATGRQLREATSGGG